MGCYPFRLLVDVRRVCSKRLTCMSLCFLDDTDFDLVQEIRSHKKRRLKSGTVSPFAGMVYCADCGNTLYVSRANRTQQVDIHFRFNVVTATATSDFKQYYVRRKAV